jgi:hypothetical protein
MARKEVYRQLPRLTDEKQTNNVVFMSESGTEKLMKKKRNVDLRNSDFKSRLVLHAVYTKYLRLMLEI